MTDRPLAHPVELQAGEATDDHLLPTEAAQLRQAWLLYVFLLVAVLVGGALLDVAFE